MAVYEGCFTRLCNALAANNMYARTVGVHPSRRAELLPLVPQSGYMIMDRYFRNTGNQGGVMLRATASTRVTIRYTSEADFVRKFRVACLITPLLALLTDNVPLYQGESNHNYSIHTHIWNNVDPDRCGIYPNVMDSNLALKVTPPIFYSSRLSWHGMGRALSALGANPPLKYILPFWDMAILSRSFRCSITMSA